MIVFELMFAVAALCFLLLMIPVVLLMVGIAGVVMLWIVAPAAVLAVLVGWLAFPGLHGAIVVLLLCAVGLLLLERRSRHRAFGEF